jgi:hypothetical protein
VPPPPLGPELATVRITLLEGASSPGQIVKDDAGVLVPSNTSIDPGVRVVTVTRIVLVFVHPAVVVPVTVYVVVDDGVACADAVLVDDKPVTGVHDQVETEPVFVATDVFKVIVAPLGIVGDEVLIGVADAAVTVIPGLTTFVNVTYSVYAGTDAFVTFRR